ncbi:MAG TPA: hypothetical protein VK858_16010 [Longimicrobiales bacterium]|nr:hypothetical protein [Longimicrobiales bacterium]
MPAADRDRVVGGGPPPRRPSGWPLAIVVGLLVVVGVNLTFIYIAVSGADEVVPSYVEEER